MVVLYIFARFVCAVCCSDRARVMLCLLSHLSYGPIFVCFVPLQLLRLCRVLNFKARTGHTCVFNYRAMCRALRYYSIIWPVVKPFFRKKENHCVGSNTSWTNEKKTEDKALSYKARAAGNNTTRGDYILHEQEYRIRHGIPAIPDEVRRDARRQTVRLEI